MDRLSGNRFLDNYCNGVLVGMSPIKRAINVKIAWLDQQQDLTLDQVDSIIEDLRGLVKLSRYDMTAHLLTMALSLGIRAEHQAAAHLHDAYRVLKTTPPPRRTGA